MAVSVIAAPAGCAPVVRRLHDLAAPHFHHVVGRPMPPRLRLGIGDRRPDDVEECAAPNVAYRPDIVEKVRQYFSVEILCPDEQRVGIIYSIMFWTLNHRCSNRAQILWQRLFQQYRPLNGRSSMLIRQSAVAPKATSRSGNRSFLATTKSKVWRAPRQRDPRLVRLRQVVESRNTRLPDQASDLG
jgi:hypothetical protein